MQNFVMASPNELLLEIACCPVARDIRAGKVDSHECLRIVKTQDGKRPFQVPEPWVGQIEHAPILFISSNPSFDEKEKFPTDNAKDWPSERIVDFFENRFTSRAGWVKNLGVLHHDGIYSKPVRFWVSARARAAEILQKKNKQVAPGVDFALTEVVHCKSKGEIGVNEARDFCSKRYLKRILSVAAARVLVVYGRVAHDAVRGLPQVGGATEQRLLGPLVVHGRSRILVFLPHPNARKVTKGFGADELAALRSHLGSKSQA
jgi:hypothetical protein